MSDDNRPAPGAAFFLPDLCRPRAVAAVAVIAELVALVITISRDSSPLGAWIDLLRISLFLQWIALCSAAVLCLSRRHLTHLPVPQAALASYALLLLTTVTLSEAAFRALDYIGLTPSVIATDHRGFLLRNLGISAIISAAVLRYLYVQQQWKENVKREAGTRIEALQARIRPHFLFNSLNTIAALVRERPEVAEESIDDLADLFRASLSDAGTLVSLSEEIRITRQYEHIETLRLGERLRVHWDLDALPPTAQVPRLTLQPLLENAIYHGIEQIGEGGEVAISGRVIGDRAEIEIHNPLPRVAGAHTTRQGNRMALGNVSERLALAYGGQARLEASAEAGSYCVRLIFPLTKGAPA